MPTKIYLFRPKALSWKDISPPAGWTWSLPFTIQQKGRSFRVKSGWTIDQNKPTGKTYYVSTTGNEANDGLTPGTALRKIYTAFTKADVDVVSIAAGTYGWTNGWSRQNLTRSVSFIPTGGRVVIGTFAEGLSWSADSASYKATRSHVLKVADASNLNVKGDFTFLALVADAATCKATVNSWYTDATTVWVHTFDSRSPDVNVRCYFDNANNGGVSTANTTTTYFENIDFEGSAANSCFGVGHVTNLKTVYFNNCTFKYAAAGNGFMAAPGAVTYLKDCVAACNFMDGLSYKATAGAAPKAVEINCIGRDNGSTGDLDNGSTSHEGTSIVRIMGEYARNVGRNVHDISNSTLSWNLGCNSHDSTSAVNDCNFGAGTGAETTKMWLDCCTSSGSATDLEEAAAAVLSYRNLISDGVFVGTPVSY